MAADNDHKLLEVNLQVCLTVSDGRMAGDYSSRIEAISGDQIELSTPLKKGKTIWIPQDTDIKVCFSRTESRIEGRYLFRSRVLNHRREPLPILIIEAPQEIKRIQNREFFRLPARIPVKYKILSDQEEVDEEEERLEDHSDYMTGYTVDISGSGLLLNIEDNHIQEFEEGTELRIILNLDGELVFTRGRVARFCDLPEYDHNNRGLGIEFVNIDRPTRENIIQWIFKRQRDLRKKGLL